MRRTHKDLTKDKIKSAEHGGPGDQVYATLAVAHALLAVNETLERLLNEKKRNG